MPQTFTKVILSGSTNGKQIKVAATSSPGTTIHTADLTALDEIWVFVYNSSGSSVVLTLQHGGTASPDDDQKVTVPSQSGLLLVVPGLLLTNSLVLKAYAGTTNVLMLSGFVNRIT